jgi:hypothetical protein
MMLPLKQMFISHICRQTHSYTKAVYKKVRFLILYERFHSNIVRKTDYHYGFFAALFTNSRFTSDVSLYCGMKVEHAPYKTDQPRLWRKAFLKCFFLKTLFRLDSSGSCLISLL